MTPAFHRALRIFATASVLLFATSSATAQATAEDPKAWQEAEAVLPQQVNLDKVIEFDLDRRSALRFGIESDSLRIGPDGVVRYVFVARSTSGALNVLYEGIRCQTGEVKLYALWDPGTGWTPATSSAWIPLSFRGATRRAMQMARGGICFNSLPNGDPRKMLDTLRNGATELQR